jgi:brefeldin A-resistance guanine nucleotide exchange factor 1
MTAASLFNHKPKLGLAMLEKEGLIKPEPNSEGTDAEKMDRARAQFLRNSTRLDKKLLGEYISRPDGIGLLKAFIGLFDFAGVSRSIGNWDIG